MFFLYHKALLNRFLLVAMGLFLLVSNQINAEQTTKQTDPAAKNWYQVEVILFDQKTITGSEKAPKTLDLSFPENWLELSSEYPKLGIMRHPIFDPSSTASINDLNNHDLSQKLSALLGTEQYLSQYYNDGSILIPEATIPYQTADNENIEQNAQLETNELELYELPEASQPQTEITNMDFKPVYEQPFQKLSKEYRDLNDTARGLDRRQYKVRFHEAWRFQIGSKDNSPWIMVNTEKALFNRQIIEGSLRFYKSRYLHFESDLWRINFSPSENLDIVLPVTPEKNLNPEEENLLKALRFSRKFASLVPRLDHHGIQADGGPESLLQALAGYDLNTLTQMLDSPRDTTAQLSTSVDTNQYPIKEIWPIKQSKRIKEDEVYYIDHPHMGALVSIKSYEPIPINLPPKTQQEEDISTLEETQR